MRGISGKALDLLVRYDWPGNIRELENCIERAVIMAREEAIVPADFPPQIRMLSGEEGKGVFAIPSGISLNDMEQALIVKTLAEMGGNRTRASEILGINRRTLQNKLKQYVLDTKGAGQPSPTWKISRNRFPQISQYDPGELTQATGKPRSMRSL